MSHLGMKILYHMLNDREDTVCERVFAPWDDMEAEMRENNIPLLSMRAMYRFVTLILWASLSNMK